MPVPVVITHPAGAGIAAAHQTSLQTEGPFERMARLRAEAEKAKQQQQEPNAEACSISGAAAAAAATGAAASTPPGLAPQQQQQAAAPSTSSGAGGDSGTPAQPAILVSNLEFSYPGLDGRPIPGRPPLITGMSLSLAPGDRCLLLGANGAGKTTLLKILAGKHMVPREQVLVLGEPPFHATELTTSGALAYVGGTWTRDIAFAGTSVPLTGDFPARRMIDAVPGADEARKTRLMHVLDVDPEWRMHQVSDGQRRRVQLCVGLLRPFKVLLLDEVTVDLDVLGRSDLMRFLADECASRGAAMLYATHIFDGLEGWPTHVAYVARGRLQFCRPTAELPQLARGELLELVTGLLREEQQAAAKAGAVKPVEFDPSLEGAVDPAFSYAFNNGWVPGTLGTSLAHGSNAVMRG